MKGFSISIFLFLISFFGTAHAENVYDMKHQGYVLKQQLGPDHAFDAIPVSHLSTLNLAFSGNTFVYMDDAFGVNEGNCCSLHLGNQGSFSVVFDQPVTSAGLNIFPVILDPSSAFADLYDTATVSAIYRDSEGAVVGQSSATANWLGSLEQGNWQWNNTYNGHENAFGVSNTSGFNQITFSVDGGGAEFFFKGLLYGDKLRLASSELYYSYLDPNYNPPPVPEPETYAMMLAGLGVLGFVASRRRKSSKPA